MRVSTGRFIVAVMGICGVILAQDQQAKGRDELLLMERQWNAAHMRGDADTLGRLWANDLEVAVPKMPVMKKDDLINFVRSGRMAFQQYETSDLNIRIYGQIAVVTGRLKRLRTMGGRDIVDDWRFTKLSERGADGWRVVSFHASEASTP